MICDRSLLTSRTLDFRVLCRFPKVNIWSCTTLLLNEASEKKSRNLNEVSETLSEIRPRFPVLAFLAGRNVIPQNLTRFLPSEISNQKFQTKFRKKKFKTYLGTEICNLGGGGALPLDFFSIFSSGFSPFLQVYCVIYGEHCPISGRRKSVEFKNQENQEGANREKLTVKKIINKDNSFFTIYVPYKP